VTATSGGPIVNPPVIHESGESRRNDTERVKPKNSEKNQPQCATLPTTNLTRALSGERTDTNRLSHGTAEPTPILALHSFIKVT
jgi:hypothetical protein